MERFSPAEAAAICGIRPFDVQTAIDRRWIVPTMARRPDKEPISRERNKSLSLTFDDLAWLWIWNSIGEALSLQHRHALWAVLPAGVKADQVRIGDLLIVDIAAARSQVAERVSQLTAAKGIICKGLDGEMVFKGTEQLVYSTVAKMKAGRSKAEILLANPGLEPGWLDLAVLWVSAYPRRGRPTLQSRRLEKL